MQIVILSFPLSCYGILTSQNILHAVQESAVDEFTKVFFAAIHSLMLQCMILYNHFDDGISIGVCFISVRCIFTC